MSFAGFQRFYMGNDPPAIVHRDGGGKGRLSAIGNSVTDLFKEGALGHGLNPGTLKISGQGVNVPLPS